MESQPSIPSAVPWDPAELKGRDCEHCACYFEMPHAENPGNYQGFCRRQPADILQQRMNVPRLDRDLKPVFKDGKQVMNSEVVIGFIYKPAQRQGTCFDGYRPQGTLPGERPMDPNTREVLLGIIDKAGELLEPGLRAQVVTLLND